MGRTPEEIYIVMSKEGVSPYENLASAVIIRACKDYYHYLVELQSGYKLRSDSSVYKNGLQAKSFLYSELADFYAGPNCDLTFIIRHVEHAAQNHKPLKRRTNESF